MNFLSRIFAKPEVTPPPVDWEARLAADVKRRKLLVGEPYAKRRAAALKVVRLDYGGRHTPVRAGFSK